MDSGQASSTISSHVRRQWSVGDVSAPSDPERAPSSLATLRASLTRRGDTKSMLLTAVQLLSTDGRAFLSADGAAEASHERAVMLCVRVIAETCCWEECEQAGEMLAECWRSWRGLNAHNCAQVAVCVGVACQSRDTHVHTTHARVCARAVFARACCGYDHITACTLAHCVLCPCPATVPAASAAHCSADTTTSRDSQQQLTAAPSTSTDDLITQTAAPPVTHICDDYQHTYSRADLEEYAVRLVDGKVAADLLDLSRHITPLLAPSIAGVPQLGKHWPGVCHTVVSPACVSVCLLTLLCLVVHHPAYAHTPSLLLAATMCVCRVVPLLSARLHCLRLYTRALLVPQLHSVAEAAYAKHHVHDLFVTVCVFALTTFAYIYTYMHAPMSPLSFLFALSVATLVLIVCSLCLYFNSRAHSFSCNSFGRLLVFCLLHPLLIGVCDVCFGVNHYSLLVAAVSFHLSAALCCIYAYRASNLIQPAEILVPAYWCLVLVVLFRNHASLSHLVDWPTILLALFCVLVWCTCVCVCARVQSNHADTHTPRLHCCSQMALLIVILFVWFIMYTHTHSECHASAEGFIAETSNSPLIDGASVCTSASRWRLCGVGGEILSVRTHTPYMWRPLLVALSSLFALDIGMFRHWGLVHTHITVQLPAPSLHLFHAVSPALPVDVYLTVDGAEAMDYREGDVIEFDGWFHRDCESTLNHQAGDPVHQLGVGDSCGWVVADRFVCVQCHGRSYNSYMGGVRPVWLVADWITGLLNRTCAFVGRPLFVF